MKKIEEVTCIKFEDRNKNYLKEMILKSIKHRSERFFPKMIPHLQKKISFWESILIWSISYGLNLSQLYPQFNLRSSKRPLSPRYSPKPTFTTAQIRESKSEIVSSETNHRLPMRNHCYCIVIEPRIRTTLNLYLEVIVILTWDDKVVHNFQSLEKYVPRRISFTRFIS